MRRNKCERKMIECFKDKRDNLDENESENKIFDTK